MAKFNRDGIRAAVSSPVKSAANPTGRTHEGAPGYARDAKSELFLLAVANMAGERSFYESAGARDGRFRDLVHTVAVEDGEWTAGFLPWLRGEGNMRSASVVTAVEAVKARLDAGQQGGNRQLVDTVLQRADEPGEALAYWTSTYGRAIPKPIKRGIADAVRRLYNERCVTPDTLVLKRDLSWVRAGDLRVGDDLVAFDETVGGQGKGQSAKMRLAIVTATRNAKLETVRVVTDKGKTSVSTDHQFVVTNNSRNREWWRAGDLQPGDRLVFFGTPWTEDNSRDAAWLAGAAWRFGDVLDLVHPAPDPGKPWQGELFKHAIDRRHGREAEHALPMLLAREALMATPADERRAVLLGPDGPERLRAAGLTWEALAGWLRGPMDAAAWEAIIPSMGVMALVRNLRNFDQAGVSDAVAEQVAARLADPEVIAKSRMFPFRFLTAHKAAPSLRWAWPLEQALNHSLANVPRLSGRTLILVDRSGSMFGGVSGKSGLNRADSAAIFGTALAVRAAVTPSAG